MTTQPYSQRAKDIPLSCDFCIGVTVLEIFYTESTKNLFSSALFTVSHRGLHHYMSAVSISSNTLQSPRGSIFRKSRVILASDILSQCTHVTKRSHTDI